MFCIIKYNGTNIRMLSTPVTIFLCDLLTLWFDLLHVPEPHHQKILWN